MAGVHTSHRGLTGDKGTHFDNPRDLSGRPKGHHGSSFHRLSEAFTRRNFVEGGQIIHGLGLFFGHLPSEGHLLIKGLTLCNFGYKAHSFTKQTESPWNRPFFDGLQSGAKALTVPFLAVTSTLQLLIKLTMRLQCLFQPLYFPIKRAFVQWSLAKRYSKPP
jgi:hypothetical protein